MINTTLAGVRAHVRAYVVAFALMLMSVTGVFGQVTTATIYGSVVDPSGAVVSGAEITSTNEGTGAAVRTASNAAGEFTLTALPRGSYSIAIQANGFKPARQTGLSLAAG